MQMETEYLLTSETKEAAQRIARLWSGPVDVDGCFFKGYDVDVFGVMEKVIKLVRQMEEADSKDNFTVAGKCISDYDAIAFFIEYSGDVPTIKSTQADPEENEARFYSICEANCEDAPSFLKRNKKRTFEQAIKDDIPLGGFLNLEYEEWVSEILGRDA